MRCNKREAGLQLSAECLPSRCEALGLNQEPQSGGENMFASEGIKGLISASCHEKKEEYEQTG